jgi:putative ABC transport system permease protein
MTRSLLTLRSLTHYWRWHLGLFLGVALTAAVISGSLVTGDSVRATLARQAEFRLGRVATAAAATDGFFTEALAEKVRTKVTDQTPVEPVLMLQGSITEPVAQRRASGVNIYGVRPGSGGDHGFWNFAPVKPASANDSASAVPPRPPLGEGILINRALAEALGHPTTVTEATKGQEVVLRFEKPGFISRDAPLSGESDQTVTLRIKVDGVLSDDEFGAFSLAAGQPSTLNAWLPLAKLQELAGMPGRANLMLFLEADRGRAETAIKESLTIEDAGLTLTDAGNVRVLSTSRIFLAEGLAARVKEQFPAAEGVLTYLVNEIRTGDKLTPYSMATAAVLPGARGATIHQWLADDLGVKTGDSLTLKFFRVTRARQLEEAEAKVTIGNVVPMNDPLVRRDWTPDFPGVTETENCRDWKPGIPINQEIIREKDDAYWRQYKGTPKLWLPLAEGQQLWSSRFGSLTSFRIQGPETVADISAKLAAALTPAEAGINVVAVKEMAALAVSEGMDFGLLFVSMSAFLIGAALLLSALLFVFGIEQRAVQCGVLRAAGWTGKEVRGLFLREALWLAVPAAVAGAFAGLLNTRWTLAKLQSDWADAALGMQFHVSVRPLSLIIAALVTLELAFCVVWMATRRLLRAQPRTLLSGALTTGGPEKNSRWRRWIKFVPIGVATVLAVAMLIFTPRVPQHVAPGLFFGAAFFLLADGLRVLNWRLKKADKTAAAQGMESVWSLGVRNTTRRRGRSVALTGLLALGIFMITALNAFRQDARLQENTRQSGAGGFAFVGESTLPIYEDLNTAAGQKAWDFEPDELAGVKFVPFRVRDGEEASCLNLNRAQTPRVLGLSTAAMPHEAFPFANEANKAAGWLELNDSGEERAEPGAIPAIMDQYSAMFALGKSQGGIITVPDSRGEPVKLQIMGLLAGSVLQGNVIISEENFIRLYPDTKGYRYFLVDVPAARAEKFRKLAVEQLSTRDFALTPATERLAQFQAVQNTYLTIFSTLGGLALLLSTIGLAVLVARNVMERRAEFATLTASGFRPGQLRLMVLAEHWFLFFAAIGLGCGAAVIAVWPNLKLAGAGGIPLGTLALILAALLGGGLAFCALAARLAITRRITTALRAN